MRIISNNYIYNQQFNQHAFRTEGMNGTEIYVQVIWNNVLVPRYFISNYGNIYDSKKRRTVSQNMGNDGYYTASIDVNHIGGTKKSVRTHRLMMMSFNPLPFGYNYANYTVKMCNERKRDLRLDNLYWVASAKANIQNNILVNNGGYYPMASVVDININNRRNLVSEGKHTFDDGSSNSSFTPNNIINKNRYKSITDHFNLRKISGDIRFVYSICELLSNGNSYTFMDIMRMFNVPKEEQIHLYHFICCLVNGDTYREVVALYPPLTKPLNAEEILIEQVQRLSP